MLQCRVGPAQVGTKVNQTIVAFSVDHDAPLEPFHDVDHALAILFGYPSVRATESGPNTFRSEPGRSLEALDGLCFVSRSRS